MDKQVLFINFLKAFSIILFFLFAGLLIVLYPMFFISFDLMPGDLGDARFINYILEHAYLFVNHIHPHTSFWNLPMFYPVKNTLSLSDFMLGGMIIYVPVRFFVKSPQTSLQIWLIIVCILNYLSMYLMLKVLKFKTLPSAFGAFIFAFCLPRNLQICHLQLYTQFYMIFSLTALFYVRKNNTKIKNLVLFLTASVLFVLQLYTAFYFGWFMVFTAFIVIIVLSMFKQSRTELFNNVKYFKKELVISFIFIIILCIPLLSHYLAVDIKVPWNEYGLIKWYSLFSSDSLLDSFIFKNKFPYDLENQIGIGYITTIFALVGILLNKKYRKYIIIFLLISIIFFAEKHLYYYLYKVFPGANVIRAAGRIFFILLPLYCVSLAFLCQNIRSKMFLSLICLIVIIEQIPNTIYYEWTKTEHNGRLAEYIVPKKCKVIAYKVKAKPSWKIYNDIIWVGIRDKVYTVNGYSGYFPSCDYKAAKNKCTFIIEKQPEAKNNIINVEHRYTVH